MYLILIEILLTIIALYRTSVSSHDGDSGEGNGSEVSGVDMYLYVLIPLLLTYSLTTALNITHSLTFILTHSLTPSLTTGTH